MVTTESNRVQSAGAAPFERESQAFTSSAGTVGKEPQAEPRESLFLRDPVRFASRVVAGATIGSMCGLSALVLAILGLSGVAPTLMLPVAGIVLSVAFLTLVQSALSGNACFDTQNMRLPGIGSFSSAAWPPC